MVQVLIIFDDKVSPDRYFWRTNIEIPMKEHAQEASTENLELLKMLKADTAQLHDEVEKAMKSDRLLCDDFSKEEYAVLLQKLLLAHSSLEPVLQANAEISEVEGLQAEFRLTKREALVKDLEKLGHPAHSITVDLPALQQGPEAWGALYVLEGSSLGGAMILKNLMKKEIALTEAFSFYGYYGADTGRLWKQFKTLFEEHNTSDEETYRHVLNGANRAYQVFISAARAVDGAM